MAIHDYLIALCYVSIGVAMVCAAMLATIDLLCDEENDE